MDVRPADEDSSIKVVGVVANMANMECIGKYGMQSTTDSLATVW